MIKTPHCITTLLPPSQVGYLTLVSWLDSRQEKKDQETPVLKR
jgi:hypothetical protein